MMIHNGVDLETFIEQVTDRKERLRQHAVWSHILPPCRGPEYQGNGMTKRRGCIYDGNTLSFQSPTAGLLREGQDHCDACQICAGSVDDVKIADRAGADRIELNSALASVVDGARGIMKFTEQDIIDMTIAERTVWQELLVPCFACYAKRRTGGSTSINSAVALEDPPRETELPGLTIEGERNCLYCLRIIDRSHRTEEITA